MTTPSHLPSTTHMHITEIVQHQLTFPGAVPHHTMISMINFFLSAGLEDSVLLDVTITDHDFFLYSIRSWLPSFMSSWLSGVPSSLDNVISHLKFLVGLVVSHSNLP